MTYVIIHALAPIFVIMLLGFWAGKAGMVDNKNVSLLNIFVMDFALPATLFSATVQTPWAGIVAQSPLVLVLTGAMWITYAGIYFLATSVFKRTPQDAAVLTLTVALPNYAALGLAATAAALFLTGVILSARKLQINALIATSTLVKLLVQPFIAWGLVMLLGLHGSIAITAILMIALAAGFFGVVFGNRFGVQSPDAEAVLLLSSVLCILSLPLFISLTSGL
ncbi:AEC family transporter [Klebsiella quasipneumoniae]|uniref:AEC family transporter n=1 Tax=Klebsiella quasipneumoniae TaxID=1463165 RepID=UPI0011B3FA11|nr:AEC family transporter [Klebsiella quasipneumoniae]TWV31813.1 hypothetical protein FRA07_01810 [Klebsiella quasipneumoniae subsp. similipneumoniae]